MEIVSPSQRSTGISFQVSGATSPIPSRITTVNGNIAINTEDESNAKSDSWKDRVEK